MKDKILIFDGRQRILTFELVRFKSEPDGWFLEPAPSAKQLPHLSDSEDLAGALDNAFKISNLGQRQSGYSEWEWRDGEGELQLGTTLVLGHGLPNVGSEKIQPVLFGLFNEAESTGRLKVFYTTETALTGVKRKVRLRTVRVEKEKLGRLITGLPSQR